MTGARIPLIMTRPEGSNARFLDQMPDQLRERFQVVISPLIEIVPHHKMPDIAAGDAVIFTSANGVRFAPMGQGRVAYCVGNVTTRAAAEKGWRSQCLGETSEALVAEFKATLPDVKIWHLSGVHTRGEITERLLRAGMDVTRIPLYDQKQLPLNCAARECLLAKEQLIVPIFSPRTAVQFAQTCPAEARPHLLALSDAVAEPLRILDVRSVQIAGSPNARAMLDGLEKLVMRISLG